MRLGACSEDRPRARSDRTASGFIAMAGSVSSTPLRARRLGTPLWASSSCRRVSCCSRCTRAVRPRPCCRRPRGRPSVRRAGRAHRHTSSLTSQASDPGGGVGWVPPARVSSTQHNVLRWVLETVVPVAIGLKLECRALLRALLMRFACPCFSRDAFSFIIKQLCSATKKEVGDGIGC